jgi:hypothetical protein
VAAASGPSAGVARRVRPGIACIQLITRFQLSGVRVETGTGSKPGEETAPNMSSTKYRQIRGLLPDPATAILVTIGDDRYVLSRSVMLRVDGQDVIPGPARIFADLADGVYAIRATRPPLRDPGQEPDATAIKETLDRLASVTDWRPVKSTRWALLSGPGASSAQILARRDGDRRRRATAVSTALWHHWNAVFGNHRFGWTMCAYQPDNRPGHALKIDVASHRAGTWTAGYLQPVHVGEPQLYLAGYLAQTASR